MYCIARIKKHGCDTRDVIENGGVEWCTVTGDTVEAGLKACRRRASELKREHPEDEFLVVPSDCVAVIDDPDHCDMDGYDGDPDDDDAIEAYHRTSEEDGARSMSV